MHKLYCCFFFSFFSIGNSKKYIIFIMENFSVLKVKLKNRWWPQCPLPPHNSHRVKHVLVSHRVLNCTQSDLALNTQGSILTFILQMVFFCTRSIFALGLTLYTCCIGDDDDAETEPDKAETPHYGHVGGYCGVFKK